MFDHTTETRHLVARSASRSEARAGGPRRIGRPRSDVLAGLRPGRSQALVGKLCVNSRERRWPATSARGRTTACSALVGGGRLSHGPALWLVPPEPDAADVGDEFIARVEHPPILGRAPTGRVGTVLGCTRRADGPSECGVCPVAVGSGPDITRGELLGVGEVLDDEPVVDVLHAIGALIPQQRVGSAARCVDHIIDSTIRDTIDNIAGDTIGLTIGDTIDGIINGTVEGIADDPIDDIIDDPVDRTIDDSIDDIIDDPIDDIVNGTIDDTVEHFASVPAS